MAIPTVADLQGKSIVMIGNTASFSSKDFAEFLAPLDVSITLTFTKATALAFYNPIALDTEKAKAANAAGITLISYADAQKFCTGPDYRNWLITKLVTPSGAFKKATLKTADAYHVPAFEHKCSQKLRVALGVAGLTPVHHSTNLTPQTLIFLNHPPAGQSHTTHYNRRLVGFLTAPPLNAGFFKTVDVEAVLKPTIPTKSTPAHLLGGWVRVFGASLSRVAALIAAYDGQVSFSYYDDDMSGPPAALYWEGIKGLDQAQAYAKSKNIASSLLYSFAELAGLAPLPVTNYHVPMEKLQPGCSIYIGELAPPGGIATQLLKRGFFPKDSIKGPGIGRTAAILLHTEGPPTVYQIAPLAQHHTPVVDLNWLHAFIKIKPELPPLDYEAFMQKVCAVDSTFGKEVKPNNPLEPLPKVGGHAIDWAAPPPPHWPDDSLVLAQKPHAAPIEIQAPTSGPALTLAWLKGRTARLFVTDGKYGPLERDLAAVSVKTTSHGKFADFCIYDLENAALAGKFQAKAKTKSATDKPAYPYHEWHTFISIAGPKLVVWPTPGTKPLQSSTLNKHRVWLTPKEFWGSAADHTTARTMLQAFGAVLAEPHVSLLIQPADLAIVPQTWVSLKPTSLIASKALGVFQFMEKTHTPVYSFDQVFALFTQAGLTWRSLPLDTKTDRKSWMPTAVAPLNTPATSDPKLKSAHFTTEPIVGTPPRHDLIDEAAKLAYGAYKPFRYPEITPYIDHNSAYWYKGCGYNTMNNIFTFHNKADNNVRQMIENFGLRIALTKQHTHKKLYRGIRTNDNNCVKYYKLKAGDSFVKPAFASTAHVQKFSFGWSSSPGTTQLEIECPDEYNGYDYPESEYEIVLPPDTTFEITAAGWLGSPEFPLSHSPLYAEYGDWNKHEYPKLGGRFYIIRCKMVQSPHWTTPQLANGIDTALIDHSSETCLELDDTWRSEAVNF